MKRTLNSVFLAAITGLAASSAWGQNIWTNRAGNLNWSDPLNWSLGLAPQPLDAVVMEDGLYLTGYTNAAGAINNIVDASLTVGSLAYTTTNTHFYTTLIPAGQTLALGGNGTEPTLVAGASYFLTGTRTNFATVAGAGSLVVSNPVGRIEVRQVGRANLKLAPLTNFTATVSNLWVAVAFDPTTASGPAGALFLAQTNTITTAANPAAPGIIIGRSATNSGYGQMTLGRQTTFNTDGLVVGGNRATSFSPVNQLTFQTNTTNNLFILRGSAGGATAVFSVGDVAATETGYSAAPAVFSTLNALADFSGGTVDIMADLLNVARSGLDGGDPANNRGGVSASLLFENGTFDATNVNVGYYQASAAQSWAQGTLTVRSNAVLNVHNNLTLAFLNTTNGMAFSPTVGTLNVNDSAVVNVGGNVIDGGGYSVINLAGGGINLQPAWSAVPGNLRVRSLNGFGAITNGGAITLNGTNILGTLTTPGAIVLGGSTTFDTNTIIYFNVGTNNTPGPAGGSDYLAVTGPSAQFNNPRLYLSLAGPLTPGATYRLIDCTNALAVTGAVNAESPRYAPVLVTSTGVVMVVNANTNVGTVTWGGGLGNVWDTSLANTNWSFGGTPDAYHQLDSVVFDDTSSNPVVWPSGLLNPGSITFNGNNQNFYVTNRYGTTPAGGVGGPTGITKNGTDTVVWGITNTFTGPINLNNGVFKLLDPTFTTPGGAWVLGPSNGPVTITPGATLDIAGVGAISYGKTNFIAGTGFNGQGAVTNSSTSGSPTERWYFRLAGDATIALNTAPMTIQNPAQAATYGGWFDLNGFTLTKSGASALVFQQSSVTNSGNLNVAGGELRLNHAFLGGSGSLNLSNLTILSCASGSTTSLVTKAAINIGAGAGAAIVAPNNASASTPTFLIGSPINLGGALLVSNVMVVRVTNTISGGGSLTKAGNSNLVVTVPATYTGPTVITAGRLVLTNSGSLASTNILINNPGTWDISANGYTLAAGQSVSLNATNAVLGNLTVPAGATVLGTGTNRGSLTVNAGGVLSPGPLTSVGTLVVSNVLTLNGAGVPFQLGGDTSVGAGINDLVQCSNLVLTGVSTITVSPVGALVSTPGSTYTLFTYAGALTGAAANLSVVSANPRYSFAIINPATTPGSIQVQVTSLGSAVDVWQGLAAVNPSTWNIGGALNWLNGGAAGVYFDGDTVVFNDLGRTNGVDLAGTLAPAAIIVSNNATPYTLRGSGRIQAGTVTLDPSSTGGLVIANSTSNTVIGAGISLGAGTTLTFNQPTNTLLASTLSGTGTLLKLGTNALTVAGASDPGFTGTNLISTGTLRPGSPGALGGSAATIIVAAGATLDLNGQPVSDSVFASGGGVNGTGAVNNTGGQLTTNHSLAGLVLTGPTTLGASSNRWDIGGWVPDPASLASQPPWVSVGSYFNAQSNSLTKVGPGDIYLHGSGENYLADVNIGAGRLVIDNPTWQFNPTPTLGYVQNTITVSNGGTLGLGGGFPYQQQANGVTWGVDGGTKPLHLLSGGALEAVSGNSILSGNVTLETNATVLADSGGLVTLAGTIGGPGALRIAGSGRVEITGTNSYQTNTLVTGGTLLVGGASALPTGSHVVVTNNFSTLALENSTLIDSANSLTLNHGGALTGDGTWSGPVQLVGSAFTLNGSTNGLFITGPVDASAATGTVTMDFDAIELDTALRFPGTVNINYASGLSAGTLHRPILTLSAQNYWTNMTVARARINIRTNNALPPLAPIFAGSLIAGFDDRTLIVDLGGFNQTLASLTANFGYINDFRIGNSSTNSDSVLTYAGTGANTWSAVIQDDLDSNGGKTIGLNLTSGSLTLSALSTYTGPTTVQGGKLLVTGELGQTAVTVTGTGTLGGTGIIDGSVTNGPGGTLSPGLFIGSLTIQGPLTLQAGGTCWFEINNATALNDTVAAGAITYGGTLVVTNLSGVAYTNGQILPLFTTTGGYAGAFANISIPGVATFDASNLTVDGTITVLSLLSTAPVSLGATTTAGQLQLNWPADHTGWHLQSQTNTTGLGPVWYDVPGSAGTNAFTVPIVPSNPPVFFRLVYP